MDENLPIYILDTSSWSKFSDLEPDNQMRSTLIGLIETGRIISPPEVFRELKNFSEPPEFVVDYEDSIKMNFNSRPSHLKRVGLIAYKFPRMVNLLGKKNKADPYLVSMAAELNQEGNDAIVISEELAFKNPNGKLPTACAAFDVKHMSLQKMLETEASLPLQNQ